MALRAISLRSSDRYELLAIIVFLIGGVACVMFIPELARHEHLESHSFMQFFSSFIWLSGFPFSTAVSVNAPMIIRCLLAILAITPMVALLIFAIRRRPDSPGVWFTLAVAMFVMLQVLAISYSRGGEFRTARYYDILLLMLPTSFSALTLLGLRRFFVAAWMFGAITSTAYFGLTTSMAGIEHNKYLADRQLENVKAFIATGDISTLQNKPKNYIPYADPIPLARILSMPKVRAMLPSEFRPADQSTLQLRAALFQHPWRYAFIGSVKNLILGHAPLIFAAGIGLLFVGMIRYGPRASRSTGPSLP